MTARSKSSKPLTLKDVAKATGFSATTVSAAFSVRPDPRYRESTLREVRAAAEKLGFRVNRQARLLRGGKSQTLLLVKSLSLHQMVVEMTIAVQAEVINGGYHLVSSELMPATDIKQIVNTISDFRVDGVILQNIYDDLLSSVIDECQKSDVKMVSIEGRRMDGVPFFMSDYRKGYGELFQHLMDVGCRKVGLVVIDIDRPNPGQWRTQCALQVLEEMSGSSIMKGEVFELSSKPAMGDMMNTYFKPAYDLMRGVLRKKSRPDAMVFLSDYFALSALQACQEAGVSVPDDIMLAGCDYTAFGQIVRPTLTSIRLPFEAMSRAAVRSLIAAIEGGGAPRGRSPALFAPELMPGASTGRATSIGPA